MTNQHPDPAQVAAERISPDGQLDTKELAAIIRQAYAEQPSPAIQERAEAAARELYEHQKNEVCRLDAVECYSAFIARHFADLEPGAELRDAAKWLVEGIEETDNWSRARCDAIAYRCKRLRAALERSK